MKLADTFSRALQHVKDLVVLHDLLLTGNERGVRKDRAKCFYKAHLFQLAKGAGLWRNRNSKLLIVGRSDTGRSHSVFSADALSVLLRSALVLSLAAVDKVRHEAISRHFATLAKSGALDEMEDVKLSKAYEIAQSARRRRGKGGKIKLRPGHKIKAEVLTQVYGDSYLSPASAAGRSRLQQREDVHTIQQSYCPPGTTASAARPAGSHLPETKSNRS
ncbi:MAG: hypothetical protein ACUVWX_06675 [Kiritimatiellia bacterium]